VWLSGVILGNSKRWYTNHQRKRTESAGHSLLLFLSSRFSLGKEFGKAPARVEVGLGRKEREAMGWDVERLRGWDGFLIGGWRRWSQSVMEEGGRLGRVT